MSAAEAAAAEKSAAVKTPTISVNDITAQIAAKMNEFSNITQSFLNVKVEDPFIVGEGKSVSCAGCVRYVIQ